MIKTMTGTNARPIPAQAELLGSLRFDWIATFFSAWIAGGLFLDGWAHEHGKVDNTFFTPWHAILYGGVFLLFAFLAINQVRNMGRGYAWQKALPAGYRLSLAGAFLFLIGGGLDLAWHNLFGFEVNLETLLSPTHLLLATSGVLMVSGPVRAAWQQKRLRTANEKKVFWPMVLSLTLILSILTFFTQFAHPYRNTYAAKSANNEQVRNDIYRMNADGSAQTRLTVNPKLGGWGSAASPDGKMIAFTVTTGNSSDKTAELYLMNADGGGWKQLTHNGGNNYLPAWSPDGKAIAFLSHQGPQADTADIYVINTDGSNAQRLTNSQSQVYGVTWSPDGKKLAFGSKQDGTWQLYTMGVDGSQQTQLTAAGIGNAPAWSPDGSKIAFNSDRDGNDDIFVVDSDGSSLVRLTDNGAYNDNPSWSPDGSRIVYASSKDGNTNIFVMNADGSNATNLSQETSAWSGVPSWSRDGRILYTTQGNPSQPTWPYQSMGVTSILLQSALLMGVMLLAVRHGTLPFGALTVMVAVNNSLMTVLHDHYELIPAALLAGILADLLLQWLKPAASQPRFAAFAFAVPVVFYSLYYLGLQLTQGVGWTIHLWLGSIFLAGITGLFVSFLLVSPLSVERGMAQEQE